MEYLLAAVDTTPITYDQRTAAYADDKSAESIAYRGTGSTNISRCKSSDGKIAMEIGNSGREETSTAIKRKIRTVAAVRAGCLEA